MTTAAFSELEGDSLMRPEVEMWPTETLQGELTARSLAKHGPTGTRRSDAAAGSWSWTKWWPVGRREAVPRGVLVKVVACGNAVSRCRGGVLVLYKAEASGNAVRWCHGGVLVLGKAETGGNAVRRCRGGVLVLDEAVAGGSAVRWCHGGVLVVT